MDDKGKAPLRIDKISRAMSTAKKVRDQISLLEEGTTFTYEELELKKSEYTAATKAMSRLISNGAIKRLSKGLFYKPKESLFGDLQPNEEEIIKTYMFEGGERIAYLTGLSLYNRMGLTTQVPKTVTLGCNKKRINTTINNLKIKSVKSYIEPSDENVRFLQILDAVKDFNKIPDSDTDDAVARLQEEIRELDDKNRDKLVKYALQYPPRVRALLGAMLSDQQSDTVFTKLKKSLNPLTTYNFGYLKNVLSTAPNWNIV